jgi:protein-arginine kinase
MNKAKTLIVWVNEEDHLTITSRQNDANLKQVYERIIKTLEILEKKLDFVKHDKLGYLTCCPTNVGSGLKIKIEINVPKIADLGKLHQQCSALNLDVKSLYDGREQSLVGLFEISNRITIKNEWEIVNETWYFKVNKIFLYSFHCFILNNLKDCHSTIDSR